MTSIIPNVLLSVLTVISVSAKPYNDISSKIIDGEFAGKIISQKEQFYEIENSGEFPYLATIFHESEPICGAVIYKKDVVLTAAHCVVKFIRKASELTVRAGTFYLNKDDDVNIQSQQVKLIKKHPKYNSCRHKDHDIAVIRLVEPFNLTQYVNTLKLPTTKQDGSFSDKTALAIGFGATRTSDRSDLLLKGTFMVKNFRLCSKVIHFFDSSMLCAYGVENEMNCHGDSGGPLVIHFPENPTKDILLGILSYSFNSKKMDCDPDYPSVSANVAYLRSWIDETVKNQL